MPCRGPRRLSDAPLVVGLNELVDSDGLMAFVGLRDPRAGPGVAKWESWHARTGDHVGRVRWSTACPVGGHRRSGHDIRAGLGGRADAMASRPTGTVGHRPVDGVCRI